VVRVRRSSLHPRLDRDTIGDAIARIQDHDRADRDAGRDLAICAGALSAHQQGDCA